MRLFFLILSAPFRRIFGLTCDVLDDPSTHWWPEWKNPDPKQPCLKTRRCIWCFKKEERMDHDWEEEKLVDSNKCQFEKKCRRCGKVEILVHHELLKCKCLRCHSTYHNWFENSHTEEEYTGDGSCYAGYFNPPTTVGDGTYYCTGCGATK